MNSKNGLTQTGPLLPVILLHSRRSAAANICLSEIYEAAVGELAIPTKRGPVFNHPTMTDTGIEMGLQMAWVGSSSKSSTNFAWSRRQIPSGGFFRYCSSNHPSPPCRPANEPLFSRPRSASSWRKKLWNGMSYLTSVDCPFAVLSK